MVKNDATYLSTLNQLSAIQKNLTSKKEILNSLVSSQKKKLLLWGSHYIILCEKNIASEKVSTAITKTTKY